MTDRAKERIVIVVAILLLLVAGGLVTCAHAQAKAFDGADSAEKIYSRIVTPIPSGTAITPSTPFKVAVTTGTGFLFGRIVAKPFKVVLSPEVENSTGSTLTGTPIEIFKVSAVSNDTLTLIGRAIGGVWTARQWVTGSAISKRLLFQDIKELQDTLNWLITSGPGSGTVTSITASSPLKMNGSAGGTTTTSGTISLPQSTGSAAGYLSSSDWNTFNGKQNALSVSSPLALASNVISMTQASAIQSGYLNLTDWTTFNNKYALPDTTGKTNQVLSVLPTGSVDWSTSGSGTVTSVDVSGGVTGLTFSNGPITNTGTITAGGTLQISNGGTGSGTRAGALNNLLPDSTGSTSKYLRIAAGGGYVWDTATGGGGGGGSGTVTSVAMTVPSFLSVSGSPITTSGTLAVTLSGTALPVVDGGTGQTSYTNGQLLIGNTSGNTLTKATLTGGTGISVTNSTGSITLANTGVTSVALTMPAEFSVAGSPITTTGTLAVTRVNQLQNLVLASPDGSTGAPSYRSLVVADLPTSIPNSSLANSSITIQGSAVSLGGSTLATNSTPTFASGTLTATTNQLTLGVTNTTTISATAPAASRVYTMPDVLADANFVMTQGNQTLAGQKTFSSSIVGSITGNAATATTLQTTRAIYGNNFNGSAALTQIIASTYGGTGNGFTKFTGPTTAEKTFTLPDADATLAYLAGAQTFTGGLTINGGLTLGTALSIGNGGTGQTTRAAAFNALVPDSTTHPDQYLHTVPGGGYEWATVSSGSGGTVTSVAVSGGSTGLTTSGGPVTTSGTITLAGTLAIANGGTGQTSASAAFNALSPMTTLGDLTYEDATPTPVRLAGNTTSTKKFLTQTGTGTISAVPAWATLVSGDIPNNAANTTGSAATLTTTRAIYGNNFDGSAALTQIIASTYGGTGNGFTKFSGPATSEKTFTLPNASATILTDNAAVTAAQGGTSFSTYTTGDFLYASATNTLSKLGIGSSNQVLQVSGGIPSWQTLTSLTNPMTTTGDIIYSSDNSGTAARLAVGGANTVLKGGTLPSYATLAVDASLQGNGIGTSFGINLANSNTFTVAQEVDKNSIHTTPTVGLTLSNTTAATSSQMEEPPFLDFKGQGWKTNATAASQTVDWRMEMLPILAAANPNASLNLAFQTNGAGYTNLVQITPSSGGAAGVLQLGDNANAYTLAFGAISAVGGGAGVTIQGQNTTGSNGAGGSLVIQSGLSTGTGQGGTIFFRTSHGGSSGSSLQTTRNLMQLIPTGTAATTAVMTMALGSATVSTGKIRLDNVSNSNTITIDQAAPSASRVYTLRDPAADGDFLMETADLSANTYAVMTTSTRGKLTSAAPTTLDVSPANPTGTSNSSYKMMGLVGGAITPATTGRLLIMMTGDLNSGATGNPTVQMRYGTGVAPANGASDVGTAIGSELQEVGIAGGSVPFSAVAIASLSSGTAYWIDAVLKSDGTSTATITNVHISVQEIK